MISSLKGLLLNSAKLSLLIVSLLYPGILFAQDEATTAPVAKHELSGENLFAAIAESVDLSSGSVALPVPLVSLPGRDGLDVSLAAFYSSNVEATVRLPNATASTGIMGVGWNLGHSRIVVDHKGTYHSPNNTYYLVTGGTAYELIRTGGSDSIREFKTSPMESWHVTYYYDDEKWEVVRNDGTIEIYGDLNSSSDAVERGIRWGNWIGDSATPGGVPYAFAWNISEIRSVTGASVRYEYFNYREKVGAHYVHTKAAYLKRIIDSLGRTVTLHYADKEPNEYYDPHTGHPEVPAGVSGPGDAYQEYYQTLYLDSLSVTSAQNVFLQGVSFSYDLRGPASEPAYTKRYLTAITHYTESGEVMPATEFEYLSHTHTWNPGALSNITTPTGAEASYTYQNLQIPSSVRTVSATAPLGIETPRPRVFIHNDYTVITWYRESSQSVSIHVYEWDGEWIHSEFGIVDVALNNGLQEFEIYTENNFFVLRSRRNTRVFTRNPAIRGRWDSTSFSSHQEDWDREKQWVATGNSFFATVHSVNPLVIRRAVWEGNTWQSDTINAGDYLDTRMHGTDNYFGLYNTYSQYPFIYSDHRVSYLSGLEWSGFEEVPSFVLFSPVIFSAGPGYIAFRDSDTGYILDWNASMSSFVLHNVGTVSLNSMMNLVDNTTTGLAQSQVARRDGSLAWQSDESVYSSVGQDFAVKKINDEYWAEYFAYDANHIIVNPSSTSGWQTPVTYPRPSGSMQAHAGSGFFTLGRTVYRIFQNGSSPDTLGILPVRSGQLLDELSPRVGLGSFISYNERAQARTGVAIFDGERLIVPNMGVGSHPLVIPGRSSYYSFSHNQERSALTGPHTVITYPGQPSHQFHEATDLHIHRVVQNSVKGYLSRPVVSGISISDGLEQRSTTYTYADYSARLDPSGYIVRNARVAGC